jgi:Ca-activated chloride channel family protein
MALPTGTVVAKLDHMSSCVRSLPVAALALILAAHAVSAQPTPTFRSGTKLVPIYATVTDSQGRLVPDLVQEEFQIFDNQKPQEISLFDNQVQPITVVVMLDTSLSMTLNMDFVKKAAEQFFIRLLPSDRATVGAFNDKIEFASDFTGDRDALIGALGDLGFGNPTRLYDAIDESLTRLRGVEGRRIVLVLTDGEDTYSKLGLGDVIQRARADEVMVYAIGQSTDLNINGRREVTRPDRGLRKLAEETGGGYFELKPKDDLGSTFTRVAQELHSQYVLGFTPATLDGKVHKLDVKVTKPGLNARARKSYIASSETSSPSSK